MSILWITFNYKLIHAVDYKIATDYQLNFLDIQLNITHIGNLSRYALCLAIIMNGFQVKLERRRSTVYGVAATMKFSEHMFLRFRNVCSEPYVRRLECASEDVPGARCDSADALHHISVYALLIRVHLQNIEYIRFCALTFRYVGPLALVRNARVAARTREFRSSVRYATLITPFGWLRAE